MARKSKQNQVQQSLELKYIVPKTPAQHQLFEAFWAPTLRPRGSQDAPGPQTNTLGGTNFM